MKIIIVGEWQWNWYEEAFFNSFKKLGIIVYKYSWYERFSNYLINKVEWKPKSKYLDLQNRILIGPEIVRINNGLLKQVSILQPEVILFYRSSHIYKRTLIKIKQKLPKSLLIQYCNDDPFGPYKNLLHWRLLKKAIPYYDINFVYREKNLSEFESLGSQNTYLLRSYFIPEKDFRIQSTIIPNAFISDVVFAGHYENDGRVNLFETILRNNYNLKLYGGGWDKQINNKNNLLNRLYPIAPVIDEEYRYAISGTKIALCILSKLNRDTYTRRNFEIPAMKTFMLSEYTEDLSTLFIEGEEAEFFKNHGECLDKIKYYINRDSLREKIAQKGFENVYRNGHDIDSRVKEVMKVITRYLSI